MQIHFPKLADFTEKELEDLCDLINNVYDVTESVLVGGKRTNLQELTNIISKQALAVAKLNTVIVGCVYVQIVDKETLMFGMLVAHPDYRSQGIGKKLVAFVESLARERGYKTVCLELLTPQNWIHEQKEFLKSWYTRSGYVKQGLVAFSKDERLVTPCEMNLYSKEI